VSSANSFVVLYLLDAASFVAAIALVLTIARPAPAEAFGPIEDRAGSYRQVIGDKVFVRVWGLIALLVALGYAQQACAFPAYASGNGGITAGTLGIAFAVNTFTVVAAQL
jgi:hypothetical protein